MPRAVPAKTPEDEKLEDDDTPNKPKSIDFSMGGDSVTGPKTIDVQDDRSFDISSGKKNVKKPELSMTMPIEQDVRTRP